MGIKNWFVRSQRVGNRQNGLISYAMYLTDKEHKNHKGISKIIPIYGSAENFVSETASSAINKELNNKKGGRRIESYAQSFVFGLPDSVNKPTPDQWKNIFKDVMRSMASTLGIATNDLKGKIFANVHEQDNPHLNIVIPRVINGSVLEKLDQRAVIGVAKKAFNASALARCGLDTSTYKPIRTNVGRRQEKWQIQQEEAEKALKLVGEATTNLYKELEKTKEISKLSMMLHSQMMKWIEAIALNDEKQEKRQENRITKTVESINELSISDEQMQMFNELFDRAEEKTGKTLQRRARLKI